MTAIAAIVYSVVTVLVVAFQLALAAGAPWGSYAMGGAFPGKLPPTIRLAAIAQAILVTATAGLTISVAGLGPPEWSPAPRSFAWVVVAFSAVGVVLNAITPSAGERRIWLPVTLVMFGSSFVVAVTAA